MILVDIKVQRDLQRCVEGYISKKDHSSPETPNILRGGIIVMLFSWLESRTATKCDWSKLHDPSQQKPFPWWGWDELINFHKIRHCFAHDENGKLLTTYQKNIVDFQKLITDGKVTRKESRTSKNVTVQPYYEIQSNRIILNDQAIQKCLSITGHFYMAIP